MSLRLLEGESLTLEAEFGVEPGLYPEVRVGALHLLAQAAVVLAAARLTAVARASFYSSTPALEDAHAACGIISPGAPAHPWPPRSIATLLLLSVLRPPTPMRQRTTAQRASTETARRDTVGVKFFP